MELLLELYSRAYNPKQPVICFDERPCFLIEDVVSPITGSDASKKEHYAYKKNGSCCLLAAIEPLTGNRLFLVRDQRRKIEYAQFLKALSEMYPDADIIHLVQDNLNTHTIDALYEAFPADEALKLAKRFQFHFTPKSASWLNMIEIEFSVLARLCLNRRIGKKDILEREVLAFAKDRSEKQIPITWQFTTLQARNKFSRHYEHILANE